MSHTAKKYASCVFDILVRLLKKIVQVVSYIFVSVVYTLLLGFAVALGILVFNSDFFEIDTCVDLGGRWDYAERICQRSAD